MFFAMQVLRFGFKFLRIFLENDNFSSPRKQFSLLFEMIGLKWKLNTTASLVGVLNLNLNPAIFSVSIGFQEI